MEFEPCRKKMCHIFYETQTNRFSHDTALFFNSLLFVRFTLSRWFNEGPNAIKFLQNRLVDLEMNSEKSGLVLKGLNPCTCINFIWFSSPKYYWIYQKMLQ